MLCCFILAFTALILVAPTLWKEDDEGKEISMGYKFEVGDKDEATVQCFLVAENDDKTAKAKIGLLKAESGLYIVFAKMIPNGK